MLKPKDKVKIKHSDGKLSGNTFVIVEVINENECYICEESAYFGEQPWMEKCETRRLVPGEMAWLTHAEWIWNEGRYPGENFYYCSNCVEGGSETGLDNFCNHCGAKMLKKGEG